MLMFLCTVLRFAKALILGDAGKFHQSKQSKPWVSAVGFSASQSIFISNYLFLLTTERPSPRT